MELRPAGRPARPDARSPQESTRGVDRFDADGIRVFGPESTSPPTPPPPEKTLSPESLKGRAQAAGGRFETGRNVAHHHACHPAPGRLQHLLRAMERAKPQANGGESTVPLPIVTVPANVESAPSTRGACFSLQIAGSAPEDLCPLEKKFRAGPARKTTNSADCTGTTIRVIAMPAPSARPDRPAAAAAACRSQRRSRWPPPA